ncbi:MAG: gas vesicle protein GvpN [Halanaerobiales bacterium]|nr:gas vesicle protein GvpN [Halanaerobiales bacterium]
MKNAASDILKIKPSNKFIETEQIKDIVERALTYMRAGYPVHFSGNTGTGKTTLALHAAGVINRPTVLLHGDDEFGPSDLLSSQQGFSRQKVVDNYIHSVVKVKEEMQHEWSDSRLITACRQGYTLIYDEFNRSQPEANNILLSILEKRMLSLPSGRKDAKYLKVHPEFRAIFTSNPQEYIGTHKTQDALLDRMITINLEGFDEQTEIEIIRSHSHLKREDAEKIYRVVHGLREQADINRKTLRRCIMIAKIMAVRDVKATYANRVFQQICRDVLLEESNKLDNVQQPETEEGKLLVHLLEEYC